MIACLPDSFQCHVNTKHECIDTHQHYIHCLDRQRDGSQPSSIDGFQSEGGREREREREREKLLQITL